MSDENLILLLDILDKLGINTEGAGTGTLFAHLAELEARLTAGRAGKLDFLDTAISSLSTSAQAVAILAYVDELESRLTATRGGYLDKLQYLCTTDYSDAPGTETVHGKLGRMGAGTYDFNTIFGALRHIAANYIGAYGDAYGVETVHGKLGRYNTGTQDNNTVFGMLRKLDARTTTVQRGQTSIDNATASIDVTISAVDLAKSFVVSANGSGSNGTVAAYLVNTTTLRVKHGTGWQNDLCCWEVVQNA